jgi:hypothetical protein
MQRMMDAMYNDGARIITMNGNAGEDNNAYVKGFFTASNYTLFDNFYGGANGNGGNVQFWQEIRSSSHGGIPIHVLLDMDGYIRQYWYGGHGPDCDDFYTPFIREQLGLP